MIREFWDAIAPLRQFAVFCMIMALAMVVDSLTVQQLVTSGAVVAVASIVLLIRS